MSEVTEKMKTVIKIQNLLDKNTFTDERAFSPALEEELLSDILALIASEKIALLDSIQDWNLANTRDYGELGNMVAAKDLEDYLYDKIRELKGE